MTKKERSNAAEPQVGTSSANGTKNRNNHGRQPPRPKPQPPKRTFSLLSLSTGEIFSKSDLDLLVRKDPRFREEYVRRFIDRCQDRFDFLDIKTCAPTRETGLRANTGRYIGAVPLISFDNGMPAGDLAVLPRFFPRKSEDSNGIRDEESTNSKKDISAVYGELVELCNILGIEAEIEFFPSSQQLVNSSPIMMPLYYEAMRFIDAAKQLTSKSWNRFSSKDIVNQSIEGEVRWDDMFLRDLDDTLCFRSPQRISILNENHREMGIIRSAFDICKTELTKTSTPPKIRFAVMRDLLTLEQRFRNIQPVAGHLVKVAQTDVPWLKQLKLKTNTILSRNIARRSAWRLDVAVLFERYVQFVFKKASVGQVLSNQKILADPKSRAWQLAHLEPDIILKRGEHTSIIDAKYKFTMLQRLDNTSAEIKKNYRHDLHQILAYSSFLGGDWKQRVILVYPSNNFVTLPQTFRMGSRSVEVTHMALPFHPNAIDNMSEEIRSFLKALDLQLSSDSSG